MALKQKIYTFFKYGLIRPSRIVNYLFISISKYLRLTRVIGKPITAMIEPTNYCNLRCPLCPTGAGLIRRNKEALSFNDFKRIVDNLGTSIMHIRLWNWGEPLLDKELPKMIKYAKSKRIFVNTSTNSFFLDEKVMENLIDSGLDQLIVSLDGASEETYNKYRKNGSFEKVVEALKKAAELKKQKKTRFPEIKLQFIVMRHNEHEIPQVIKLAKETKVNTLFFKSVGIMDPSLKEGIEKYLPKTKKFQRYDLYENKEVPLFGRVCNYLWEEITINVDGSVVPCCRDAHGDFIFGNIKRQKISEIWNNDKIVKFREMVLRNKSKIKMCKYCSGSNKDFFIDEIKIS